MPGEQSSHRDESSHSQPPQPHKGQAHAGHQQPQHAAAHHGGHHPASHPRDGQHGHPPKKKHHWWIWIVAAVVILLLVLIFTDHKKPKAPPPSPGIPVSTAKATQGNIDVMLDALGTVTPTYTVTVTSRVSGELTELHYTEGQLVKKGDLLAVIDPRPYQAVVKQVEGQLAKDEAALKNAQIDLTRYQNAYAQHAIAEQQVATQEATVDQAKGAIEIDQGNLAAAKLNVEYTRITSPIDGRAGLRMVDPGNIVTANGTAGLLTITQLQPITVIFTLAEDEIADVGTQISAGHPLQVQAFDRTQEHLEATGTLLTLDNQINPTTGTVRARANFANDHLELYPNQFVNARLRVKTLTGVTLVPTNAIQRNSDQVTVYVAGADGKAESKPIKVTVTQGDQSAVTGVNVGDAVITDGFDKLQNGSKVVVRGAK